MQLQQEHDREEPFQRGLLLVWEHWSCYLPSKKVGLKHNHFSVVVVLLEQIALDFVLGSF